MVLKGLTVSLHRAILSLTFKECRVRECRDQEIFLPWRRQVRVGGGLAGEERQVRVKSCPAATTVGPSIVTSSGGSVAGTG
ncbi:hypothetical protein E2C01_046410 [Portunus trituberculatus]|uniref:Uncharacterized protein n=1 Tax=Portunus trituberculatus TaxID=210409 RepID=A0A5B7G4P2_PORTR|nr:hypothetical protein [Portunus trituberculatus]